MKSEPNLIKKVVVITGTGRGIGLGGFRF